MVWNLAKVTLIKDEPYVAYLLTRYEKKSATSASTAWTCPTATGLCTGTTRAPSSTSAATASAWRITTRDWHLRLVKHCKWWRKLPGWHRREAEFRDWYTGLLERIQLGNDAAYAQAARAC